MLKKNWNILFPKLSGTYMGVHYNVSSFWMLVRLHNFLNCAGTQLPHLTWPCGLENPLLGHFSTVPTLKPLIWVPSFLLIKRCYLFRASSANNPEMVCILKEALNRKSFQDLKRQAYNGNNSPWVPLGLCSNYIQSFYKCLLSIY